jgi:hypothetical protein
MWTLLHDEDGVCPLSAGLGKSRMSGYRELDAKAREALEAAQLLPHGEARSKAMKEAGKLRVAAEKSKLART